MNIKYLVVVHEPKPAKPDLNTVGSYTVAVPPTAKWITAPTPERAAELANVKPGGYAEVVKERDVRRFDRAVRAPLEEVSANGTPLPTVAPMERAA